MIKQRGLTILQSLALTGRVKEMNVLCRSFSLPTLWWQCCEKVSWKDTLFLWAFILLNLLRELASYPPPRKKLRWRLRLEVMETNFKQGTLSIQWSIARRITPRTLSAKDKFHFCEVGFHTFTWSLLVYLGTDFIGQEENKKKWRGIFHDVVLRLLLKNWNKHWVAKQVHSPTALKLLSVRLYGSSFSIELP